MIKCFFYSLVLLTSSLALSAQGILTKTKALTIMMDQNFDVQISQSNLEIAGLNTNIFGSGYLPTVTGTAGVTYNRDNLSVQFQDGRDTELKGAKSDSRNAGVNLNWVVFDGFNRKYNMERNKELLNQGQLSLRATMETAIITLFTAYYGLAEAQTNVANLKESLEISKERLVRTSFGYEYGRSSRLDVSNAQVDVNTDSINLINARQVLQNTRRDLNLVLNQSPNTTYEIDTTLTFSDLAQKEFFEEQMMKNNVQILLAQSGIYVSQKDIQLAATNYMPTLSLSGALNYRQGNNNRASFLASNTNTGLTGGVNLAWDLFDGGATINNKNIAKINRNISETSYQQLKRQLEVQLENAWSDYQNKLFIVSAQRNNVAANRQNFERTVEQFKLGRITSLDFRTAQRNLLAAEISLTQALYDAKLAELTLYQLSGNIESANF